MIRATVSASRHRTRCRRIDRSPSIQPPAFVSKVDISIVIGAPPARVLRAFFDRAALGAWWETAASVTTPRVLGPYVIE